MLLEGSCHCGAVRFSVESEHAVPYQRCYCSICRKAGGGGGFLINVAGDANTLNVEGRDTLKTYRAWVERDGKRQQSKHRRHFCGECGCHLWADHENWPDLVHPVAGAIDTALPQAPSHSHMMLASKAAWVPVDASATDLRADAYPSQSIADWHAKNAR